MTPPTFPFRHYARFVGPLISVSRRAVSDRSIAIACGFRDTSTFVRAFTRVYQCTPTQWPLTAGSLDAAPVASAN
ncbi:AraC family transcriptional regulator [Pseudarthrobacter sp. YAF2]|uniref:AraC family transcriptional regulator n=1 Tax=Pseudarthrobacter sp. YAF2 TaxID=3233078 RepID=UPI003F969A3D